MALPYRNFLCTSRLETHTGSILCRESWRGIDFPVDCQVGIVPGNAALMGRCVVVGGLVEKFSRFRKHHKTVCQARRNPQLALVLGAQDFADPLAKSRCPLADIDCDIE